MDTCFEKKPGVGLVRFSIASMLAFFVASIISFVTIRFIGLNLSLIVGITSFIIIYFLATKIVLQKAVAAGELKAIGKSSFGITIFEINDQLANALAIGFSKKFGYIIVSTSFSKLCSENQSEYWAVISHEDNHIRQMHNLIELFTQILLLIVIVSIVSITMQTPILLIISYVTVTLLVLLLSRRLHRSLETMADKSIDPATLKSALNKIEEHNKSVTNSNKFSNSNWAIFSTHPKTSDRPLKPNSLKDASIAGLYVSFLIAIGLIAPLFTNAVTTSDVVVYSVGLIFSITIFGSALVVIDYLFVSTLSEYLAEKLGVKAFNTTNALNGIIALMTITAIPFLIGISDVAIVGIFTFGAIVTSTVITAASTEPLKKGLLASGISWILNSALFVLAFIILFNIIAGFG